MEETNIGSTDNLVDLDTGSLNPIVDNLFL